MPVAGSSRPDRVVTAAASSISGVPWPPFMTEVLTQSSTVPAGVLNGKETLASAFRNSRSVLVSQARQQGLTVSAG